MSDVKVIDKGWNRIKKDLKKLDKSFVKIGVLEESTYRPTNVGSGREGGEDMVAIAVKNEYGDKNVPERSFMRSTFDANKRAIARFQQENYYKILQGKMSAQVALERVGFWLQREIREKITQIHNPPNSPRTIAEKRSSNPLIDTGQLRQGIDFDVKVNK